MSEVQTFIARHAIGTAVRGPALVAHDGFSARYDLDRMNGTFSRPAHKLFGQSDVGKILVLDTAKGGVAGAWMLREMASRSRRAAGDRLQQREPNHRARRCVRRSDDDGWVR